MTAARPELSVLFISGYGDNVISRHGVLDAGLNFLKKPFTSAKLAEKVWSLLEKSRRETILVVDDDAGIRDLLKQVLVRAGYQVLEAADGREAAAAIVHQPVDLLITDLIMPEQDGLQTLRALRNQQLNLKVIAMSGAFGEKLLGRAVELGARAILRKPITPEKLIGTVRAVLASPMA